MNWDIINVRQYKYEVYDMILLSNKQLNTNSIIKKDSLNENFLILEKCNIDENQLFFLHKELIDFNEEISDLVDDLYTIAYYCEECDDNVTIIKKINILKYADSILETLLNKKYDFKSYLSAYIEDYIMYNPEFKDFILNKRDILLKIFKQDIRESINSVSYILSVINLLNITDKNFFKELSKTIECLSINYDLFSKEVLLDIIELCNKIGDLNLKHLEDRANSLLEEELSELPF